ncbi:flagellar basal body P-ring formation chaperone FlgA [Azospirillum sp. TSO22-1]|uniref:flagellar basal body P-ring formation chaperone FlgA n=1 Tax=Azospirillum sp. TSO22-1 TaxID=716789 RepID=UPI001FFE88E7|nr:flagellar basal body P-ring formation chaperone FlgA [Azospirillum sp. TSO22-1]
MLPLLPRWVAAVALVAGLAPSAGAAGSVEATLARELSASLGAAVPADARVAVLLTSPFAGAADAVRDLSYDPRTGAVRALVESGGKLYDVGARAQITVEVPVPVRRIQPGEVIAESDLTTIAMQFERITGGVVASREALVGQASRRQLSPGRLIQASAVGTPIVVQRNKPVTIVYEDGPLQLAARGRALQDAGIGDSVRVMNATSSIVVTGTVTGPQTVAVGGSAAAVATP